MDSRGTHSETSDGKHDEHERMLAQPVAAPDDNQLIGGGPPEAVVREPLMHQPSSSPADPSSPSATYVSGTTPIASSSQPSTAKRRLPEDDGYQQSNKRMRLDSRNVADSLAGPPAIATMPEFPGQAIETAPSSIVSSNLIVAPPAPTPTRDSSPEQVKEWLAWFAGCQLRASPEQVQHLQDLFGLAGSVLVGFTEQQMRDICKDNTLSSVFGVAIYNALHPKTVVAPTSMLQTPHAVSTADHIHPSVGTDVHQQRSHSGGDRFVQGAIASSAARAETHLEIEVSQLLRDFEARDARRQLELEERDARHQLELEERDARHQLELEKRDAQRQHDMEQLLLQIDQLKQALELSSLMARAPRDVGCSVMENKLPYDLQLKIPVPAGVSDEYAEFPPAVRGDLPETHAQRLLTFLWEAITRSTNQLHFVDTHATALVTGEMPDGFVSVVQRPRGTKLCWAHCISVIEAKPLLEGFHLETAVGQIVERFIRLRAHQLDREFLVFFLVDVVGVMVGCLQWKNFALRLSNRFPFKDGQALQAVWQFFADNNPAVFGFSPPTDRMAALHQQLNGFDPTIRELQPITPDSSDSKSQVIHATFVIPTSRSQAIGTVYANTTKFGVLKIGERARITREEANLKRLGRVIRDWPDMRRADPRLRFVSSTAITTSDKHEQRCMLLHPAGHCSLHHAEFRDWPNYATVMMRFVLEIQQELCDMHQAGFAHGDVKPSNMVCFAPDDAKFANQQFLPTMRAMLIDFEHCVELKANHRQLFSGTHRYASRRILLLSRGSSRSAIDIADDIEEFTYMSTDDYESLFYSALELLSTSRLPWCAHGNTDITAAITMRNALFIDDAAWEAQLTSILVDARPFLSRARTSLIRNPQLPPFARHEQ